MKHVTPLTFIRREGIDITTIAIVNITTKTKVTPQTALKRLKAAVADWIQNTKAGKECWNSSCCDLNIGDLASYETEFRSGTKKIGPHWLYRHGIEAFEILGAGEANVVNYDHVLGTEPKVDED